jgi:hypothetical protein
MVALTTWLILMPAVAAAQFGDTRNKDPKRWVSKDDPQPLYVDVDFRVPIVVVNNCDWQQWVTFLTAGDSSSDYVGGHKTWKTGITVHGPARPWTDRETKVAEIEIKHLETTKDGKVCLGVSARHEISTTKSLPKPTGAMHDLSPDVRVLTVTLEQVALEEPKKKTKVVTDTRATPPAAQMPGGAPAPGDKPADKPGDKPAEKPADKPADKPAEKPAEKPPETTGGRPSASPLPKRDPGRLLPPPPVNKPPLRASPLETPSTGAVPPAAEPKPVSGPVSPTPVAPAPPAPPSGGGDMIDAMGEGMKPGNLPLPRGKTMKDLEEEILGRDGDWLYEELKKEHDRETREQKEMAERFDLEIEPTEVMEPDPIAFMARAGRALLAWLRRPADGITALAAAATPLDPRIARVRGSRGEQVRPQDVSVAFIATGEASGPAFIVKVLNRTGKRVNVSLNDGVILAPAAGTLPARAVNARGTSSHTIVGYCVEHAKLTPSAGAIFAVAPPAVQQRYKSVTNVLRSGRLLDRFKRLSPQPDAENYGHSVRQWALWTKLEGWNQDRFTSQFLERTKKNIADMKGKWTKDVEKVVRDSAVTRWTDIGKILQIGRWIDVNEKELRRK